MYLYLTVAADLSNLFNLFARQHLPLLLARILKEKIIKKKVAELQVTKGTGDLFGMLLHLSAINSESDFFLFHFSQSLHVLHTQIKQLDKMLSQQVFYHVNKYFQSNLPDTIKTAIAYEMLILNSSV